MIGSDRYLLRSLKYLEKHHMLQSSLLAGKAARVCCESSVQKLRCLSTTDSANNSHFFLTRKDRRRHSKTFDFAASRTALSGSCFLANIVSYVRLYSSVA